MGERDLWHGFAHFFVGLTHAARGIATGSAALRARGAARLDTNAVGEGTAYGLDVADIAARAHRAQPPWA